MHLDGNRRATPETLENLETGSTGPACVGHCARAADRADRPTAQRQRL